MIMQDLTHARSDGGRANLVADLKAKIKTSKAYLDTEAFKTLEDRVNENWIGEDKKKFIQVLEASKKDIKSSLDKYCTLIEKAFSNDAKAFKTMQSNNAKSISKI